jgi:hypothetical protein
MRFRPSLPGPALLLLLALSGAWLAGTGQAVATKKTMTCKLSSEKVIEGREKRCLYVCEDKSIEGRTRALSGSCPATIQSNPR